LVNKRKRLSILLEALVARVAMVDWLGVEAAVVFGQIVLVESVPSIFVRQKRFFNLPVVHFGPDAEFEVFSSNGIPVLHHD
jgi:hypothetical protein